MSTSLHYSTINNPTLVDIVDEEWAKETLPDDGMLRLAQSGTFDSMMWVGSGMRHA
jgi:hypothetical protein